MFWTISWPVVMTLYSSLKMTLWLWDRQSPMKVNLIVILVLSIISYCSMAVRVCQLLWNYILPFCFWFCCSRISAPCEPKSLFGDKGHLIWLKAALCSVLRKKKKLKKLEYLQICGNRAVSSADGELWASSDHEVVLTFIFKYIWACSHLYWVNSMVLVALYKAAFTAKLLIVLNWPCQSPDGHTNPLNC